MYWVWFILRLLGLIGFFTVTYYNFKFDSKEGADERGERIRGKALEATTTILMFIVIVIVLSNDTFNIFPELYRELFFGIVYAYGFIMLGAIQYYKKIM